MAICSKCKREIDDKDIFCGYCGKSVTPPLDIVIDGRKNRKIKNFISKNIDSYKTNLIMLIINLMLIAGFIILSFYIIDNIWNGWLDIRKALIQISVKYKYIEEGLSLSYLERDLEILYKFILNIVFLAGSFAGIVFGGIYSLLHILLMNNIKRREKIPSKGRPVVLLKVYEFIIKIMIFVIILYLLCLGILFVINLII